MVCPLVLIWFDKLLEEEQMRQNEIPFMSAKGYPLLWLFVEKCLHREGKQYLSVPDSASCPP